MNTIAHFSETVQRIMGEEADQLAHFGSAHTLTVICAKGLLKKNFQDIINPFPAEEKSYVRYKQETGLTSQYIRPE